MDIENICVFGDSITWGAYDPENGGWVTILRNYLEPEEMHIYNCGVLSDDTRALLKRFKTEAVSRSPQLIVFAIGINDSQYTESRDNSRVPTEEFTENIEKLVSSAGEIAEKIIFIGLTRVDENKTIPVQWSDRDKNYDNTNIGHYDSLIKQACDKHGLLFLEVSEVLTNDDLEDGLHPNPDGHQKLFEKVRDSLDNKGLI